MSTFETTAYTVKDPGNGKPRRYEKKEYLYVHQLAEAKWNTLVVMYPNITKAIVPDHFIQEYCQRWDAANWSGSYGPSEGAPTEVMLKLLEKAAAQGHTNFLNGQA